MSKPTQAVQYGGNEETSTQKAVDLQTPPPPQAVDHFHTFADVDVRTTSLHHTLGALPNQASPGDHLHDGGTSPLLLSGHIITGSKTDGTAVNSIIQTLIRLGAEDQST